MASWRVLGQFSVAMPEILPEAYMCQVNYYPILRSLQFVLPARDPFATPALGPGSSSQMLPVNSY